MKKILSLLFMLLFSSILISCSDDNSNNQNYCPNDNPNGGGDETEPYDEYKAEIDWSNLNHSPYPSYAELKINELNMNNSKRIEIRNDADSEIRDMKGYMIIPNDEIKVSVHNGNSEGEYRPTYCKVEQDPTNPKKYNISSTFLKSKGYCYIRTMISPKKIMGKQEIKFNIHTFPQGYDNVSKPYDIVLDYTTNPENADINAGGKSLDLELPPVGTEIHHFQHRQKSSPMNIKIKNTTTKPVRLKWEVTKVFNKTSGNDEFNIFMSRNLGQAIDKELCYKGDTPRFGCGLFDYDEIAAGQTKTISIFPQTRFFNNTKERHDYEICIDMKMYHKGNPVAMPKNYCWTFYKEEI